MNQSNNQNKTNREYRQFLIENTNSIMKTNCESLQRESLQHTSLQHQRLEGSTQSKAYPYLFNGINDNKTPYGYETSQPKQNYISHQKIETMKINPLQDNY